MTQYAVPVTQMVIVPIISLIVLGCYVSAALFALDAILSQRKSVAFTMSLVFALIGTIVLMGWMK